MKFNQPLLFLIPLLQLSTAIVLPSIVELPTNSLMRRNPDGADAAPPVPEEAAPASPPAKKTKEEKKKDEEEKKADEEDLKRRKREALHQRVGLVGGSLRNIQIDVFGIPILPGAIKSGEPGNKASQPPAPASPEALGEQKLDPKELEKLEP